MSGEEKGRRFMERFSFGSKETPAVEPELLGFEPKPNLPPPPPVPDLASRKAADAYDPEQEEVTFEAKKNRTRLPPLDSVKGALLSAAPEHPAIRQAIAATDPEASKLGELRVSYRGAVAGAPQTQTWTLRELAPHTLFMGATGSGKTVAMKLHMWSVLRPVREDGPNGKQASEFSMNYRTLVYDAKTDLVPFFARMGFTPSRDVILTNPFDTRSACWDIARDVSNSADSQAFADIVIQDQGGDAFWQVSARETLAAVIDGLNAPIHSDGKRHWDLRHLVTILDTPDLLEQVLDRTEKGRGIVRDYIKTVDRLALSIRATLRANLTPYRLIAALWDHSKYSFSFERWSRGAGVLLVGDHYKYKDSMVRANNMLVRFAIDTLMDRHDHERLKHDLSWLYLDELKNAGRFPNFGTMLTQGRSKGIRSVLAAQGLSTLKATFDEAEAEEVLNNCGEKAIMQLGSAEDAEWAERLFSTHTVTRVSKTVPRQNPQEGSETFSEDKEARVQAREFLELESASDNGGGLHAYFHWRGKDGASNNKLHGTSVDHGMPGPPRRGAPQEFIPRKPEEYDLRVFDENDYGHLGLTRPKDDKPQGPADKSRFKLPKKYD